jgi:hypothetical protein
MNPHGRAIIFGFLISTASLAAIAGSVPGRRRQRVQRARQLHQDRGTSSFIPNSSPTWTCGDNDIRFSQGINLRERQSIS